MLLVEEPCFYSSVKGISMLNPTKIMMLEYKILLMKMTLNNPTN